jgi:L-lactate utilization protein LutB
LAIVATPRDDFLKAEHGEAGRSVLKATAGSVLKVEAEGRNVLTSGARRA